MKQTIDALVNPFKGNEDFASPDDVKKVDLETDEKIEKAFEQHKTLCRIEEYLLQKAISEMEVDLLNPSQIDFLLQKIICTNSQEQAGHGRTGLQLSKLMQKSYDAGYTDFVLHTNDTGIVYLCNKLNAKEEKPAKVTIHGDVDKCFAEHSANRIFDISGNIFDECGAFSQNCKFEIKGNAEKYLGQHSVNSKFNVGGNVGESCGRNAQGSEYNIAGNIDYFCGHKAKKCTFAIAGDANPFLGRNANGCFFAVGGEVSFSYAEFASNCTFVFAGDALRTDRILGPGNTFVVYNPEVYNKLKYKHAKVILKQ